MITEDNLIQQLKKKDPDALDFLINTYGAGVYRLVSQILAGSGRQEDIEECVSDVYVDVWHDCNSFDADKGSFKTWVLIKAKYKALDYRRKLGKSEIADENLADVIAEDKGLDVTEEVISNERRETLIRAVGQLKETYRLIVIKRYFFYESIETIAGHLGLTRQAVDNRLWRARNALKEMLQSAGEEGLL